MSLLDVDTPGSVVRGSATRRPGMWVVAAVAASVIAALAGSVWWLTHPTAVPAGGGATVGAPLAIGQTELFDAGLYTRAIDGDPNDTVPITIIDAAPRVIENSSDADIELVLCQHAGDGSDVIGAIEASALDAYCVGILPVTTANLSFPVEAQLLVQITPHQAGTVRIEGVELTYRDGIRRGTAHTGMTTITTTS